MKLPDIITTALYFKMFNYALKNKVNQFIGGKNAPYIKRWYLWRMRYLCSGYLHNILRDDDDRALHDHPYASCSIILLGGYWEVLPVDNKVPWGETKRVWRGPGSVVFRWPSQAHRLQLPQDEDTYQQECWSLFLCGPAVRKWGFWCKERWVFWKTFIDFDRLGNAGGRDGPGCGEE